MPIGEEQTLPDTKTSFPTSTRQEHLRSENTKYRKSLSDGSIFHENLMDQGITGLPSAGRLTRSVTLSRTWTLQTEVNRKKERN